MRKPSIHPRFGGCCCCCFRHACQSNLQLILVIALVLQSAQQEITILKKSEERRAQLELLLAAAEKEMAVLREQVSLAPGGDGSGGALGGISTPSFGASRSREELMSELAEFEEKYSLAEASYRGAQTEVRELQRSMQEARVREAKVRDELSELRQRCERAEKANGAPTLSSPTSSSSSRAGAGAGAGAVGVSGDASSPPPRSPKSPSEYAASEARADAVIGRLKVVEDDLAEAVEVAAHAYEVVRERGAGGSAIDALADIRRLLDKMSVVVAGAVRGTPNGGDDAVSRHMSGLRADLKSKDEQLKMMTSEAKKMEEEMRKMEGEMIKMGQALGDARVGTGGGGGQQGRRSLGGDMVDQEAMSKALEQVEEAKIAERRACEERDAALRELSRVRSSSSPSSSQSASPSKAGASDVASEGNSTVGSGESPALKRVQELQMRLLEAEKDKGALQSRVMELERERVGMERQLKSIEEGSISRQIRSMLNSFTPNSKLHKPPIGWHGMCRVTRHTQLGRIPDLFHQALSSAHCQMDERMSLTR